MPEQTSAVGMERKLAAIFSTDVVGYSRLMGDDEEATIRTLTASRTLISSLIQQHRGRVVDAPGDNLLAEFASIVDAVRCAVEIQEQLKTKNAAAPDHRQMQFRIGINLGDVIVEGERLYGDGVNIAARLESLAVPGGICISGTVHEHIRNKLALAYTDLGEQTVKNIAEPVRVYRVALNGEPVRVVGAALRGRPSSQPPGQPQGVAPTTPPTKVHKIRPAHRWVVAGLLLLVGAIVIVRYLSSPLPNPQPLTPSPQSPTPNPQSLPLPDRPSLIVLPFVNMSNDPEQEYFSDGFTEVLTGDLSKISSLFVIARNSAFTYKGKAVKVQEVGREMGVRYVLEGSVQKAAQRVRITVQLIEATTGYHLWSEQYNRPLTDIFALQDEVVQKIVTTLKLQLTLQEQGAIVHKHTENLEAYDFYLRGVESVWRAWSERKKEANGQARQMFEKAIEVDPQYAEAYAWLSMTYMLDWFYGWNRTPQVLERWSEVVRKALALDASLPVAHQSLAWLSLFQRQYEQAIAAAKQIIALDPNWAEGYLTLGNMLNFAGPPGESIEWGKQAMRLNPRYGPEYPLTLGWAYVIAGRYEEALVPLTQALPLMPDNLQLHWALVICYVELGREEEAQAAAGEMLRIAPHFSTEASRPFMPNKDPARTEHQLAALRKAGLK